MLRIVEGAEVRSFASLACTARVDARAAARQQVELRLFVEMPRPAKSRLMSSNLRAAPRLRLEHRLVGASTHMERNTELENSRNAMPAGLKIFKLLPHASGAQAPSMTASS